MLVVTRMMMVVVGKERGRPSSSSSSSLMTQSDSAALRYLFVCGVSRSKTMRMAGWLDDDDALTHMTRGEARREAAGRRLSRRLSTLVLARSSRASLVVSCSLCAASLRVRALLLNSEL